MSPLSAVSRPQAPWHAPATRQAARLPPGLVTLAVIAATVIPVGLLTPRRPPPPPGAPPALTVVSAPGGAVDPVDGVPRIVDEVVRRNRAFGDPR
jgi:hypothetical protein